jgi:hypothetical protein
VTGGQYTTIVSGYNLVDTSTYTIRDVYIGDLDGDGIIDATEIELLTAQIGNNKNDYTNTEWETTYKKYDINGDESITNSDLEILKNLVSSVARNASAIYIDSPGNYIINYSLPLDNYAATTSVFSGRNNNMQHFRNTEHGYLQKLWGAEYKGMTYDKDKDIYYLINNNTKKVIACEIDDNNQVMDRMDIQLPLFNNMELLGLAYFEYRIYVLATIDGNGYIFIVSTDISSIKDTIIRIPIHSGTLSTVKTEAYLRDSLPIANTAVGLAVINNKLFYYDSEYIYILLPLYDYMIMSADSNDQPTISFREAYETIHTLPASETIPVYQNIWNRLDFHGEKKGLIRLPGESNVSFKQRIMNTYKYFPSRDKQGSMYGIQRELGVEQIASYEPNINILPSPIVSGDIDSIRVFSGNEYIPVISSTSETVYKDGKYLNDKLTLNLSGDNTLVIDGDILLWS